MQTSPEGSPRRTGRGFPQPQQSPEYPWSSLRVPLKHPWSTQVPGTWYLELEAHASSTSARQNVPKSNLVPEGTQIDFLKPAAHASSTNATPCGWHRPVGPGTVLWYLAPSCGTRHRPVVQVPGTVLWHQVLGTVLWHLAPILAPVLVPTGREHI